MIMGVRNHGHVAQCTSNAGTLLQVTVLIV